MIMLKKVYIQVQIKMNKKFNIAIIGLGQVGIYLYNELRSKKKEIEVKTGKQINIVAISAKNINKKRKFKIDKKIFFKDPLEIFKKKKIKKNKKIFFKNPLKIFKKKKNQYLI